jgi:hypothetical protein
VLSVYINTLYLTHISLFSKGVFLNKVMWVESRAGRKVLTNSA